MEQHDPLFENTPANCFLFEELQAFQSIEACPLIDVNYYHWLHNSDVAQPQSQFLFCLELVFERHGGLLLSSGEDSSAIRIISAETLVKTARDLQKLHNRVLIQRVNCSAFSLWVPAIGENLHAVRLSRNAAGLYLNDALVLDFGTHRILVALSQREGLEVGRMKNG